MISKHFHKKQMQMITRSIEKQEKTELCELCLERITKKEKKDREGLCRDCYDLQIEKQRTDDYWAMNAHLN